jgi:sugar/nucleoside kinase (ribokinase family)
VTTRSAATTRGVSAWVSTDPELSTGTCVVLVEPGGERSMLPDSGANTALIPDDLPHRLFRPGSHLHLSGYTLLNDGPREAGLAALALAQAADMTVSVDPSSAALIDEAGVARFLGWTRGIDLLLANRDEALLLAGTDDVSSAASRLGDTYREVVIKLGRDGALWQQGFIAASAPADRVDVTDTTGAGDAFAAGFLASWLLHPEPETALAAGNRLAAQAVSRIGARP